MNEGDLILCIFASVNSSNIIKVAEYAKKKKNAVIRITGFKGGRLKKYI
jgi:phosphoheptose isomerase